MAKLDFRILTKTIKHLYVPGPLGWGHNIVLEALQTGPVSTGFLEETQLTSCEMIKERRSRGLHFGGKPRV